MLTSVLKTGGRALLRPATLEAAARAVSTTPAVAGMDKWKIPERLHNIPEAEDPNFFNMVEYYFHKACLLSEETLIRELDGMRGMTEEDKVKKVHGILRIIEPCSHVLEVNFPVMLDDGSYQMITGFR